MLVFDYGIIPYQYKKDGILVGKSITEDYYIVKDAFGIPVALYKNKYLFFDYIGRLEVKIYRIDIGINKLINEMEEAGLYPLMEKDIMNLFKGILFVDMHTELQPEDEGMLIKPIYDKNLGRIIDLP